MGMFNVANGPALDAARVGFHIAFMQKLGLPAPQDFADLFAEVKSTRKIEEWDWLADLPDFNEWDGDRVMSELKAFTLRIQNKRFSSGLKLNADDIDDDVIGLFDTAVSDLAMKAMTHRYRLMIQAWVNGFDGTQTGVNNGLAYDGLFYFSTTRATGSNKLTSALTGDNAGLVQLQLAQFMLESQTTFDGQQALDISGTDLFVGPKLRPAAEYLMKTDFFASAAGTAPQTNVMKGRFKVHVVPQLRGAWDDYWFLADLSKPIKPFIFQMRDEVTTNVLAGGGKGGPAGEVSLPKFQRNELWFGAQGRYNVGLFEPRTVVGSQL